METTQVLSEELARQQVLVHALGVDLEYVYGALDAGDSAALEVDIELVAASTTAVAAGLEAEWDAWFVDADAFADAERAPAAADELYAVPARRRMGYVVALACVALFVAACVAI